MSCMPAKIASFSQYAACWGVFFTPSSLGAIGFMKLSAASADVSSATEGHLHIVNYITHGSSRIQETVIN